MAIHFRRRHALYLHPPRCAGHAIEAVSDALDVDCTKALPYNTACSLHATRQFFPNSYNFEFTSVRHPARWIESYWRFHYGYDAKGFKPGVWYPHKGLPKQMPESFSDFIRWMLSNQPGFVSRMFEWYVGPPNLDNVDAVVRVENLAEDLAQVYQHIGHAITKPEIEAAFAEMNDKQRNASTGMLSCVWGAGLMDEFLASERPMIDRFYGSEPFEVIRKPDRKPALLKVEIGGGEYAREGFVNLDQWSGADYRINFEDQDLKIPFEDNSVDQVYSSHCFEHVDPYQPLLNEIVRICRLSAPVEIRVPHWGQSMALCGGHKHTLGEMEFQAWPNASWWTGEKKLELETIGYTPSSHFRRPHNKMVKLMDSIGEEWTKEDTYRHLGDTCHEIIAHFKVAALQPEVATS